MALFLFLAMFSVMIPTAAAIAVERRGVADITDSSVNASFMWAFNLMDPGLLSGFPQFEKMPREAVGVTKQRPRKRTALISVATMTGGVSFPEVLHPPRNPPWFSVITIIISGIYYKMAIDKYNLL